MKTKIEAPWYRYRKMVNALFADDPEIIVSEIYEPDGEINYAFDIEVNNHEKYVALNRLLPGVKTYGNVCLGIILYDVENEDNDTAEMFKAAFQGNPILEDIKTIIDIAGAKQNYVVFKPEVIQFFDDDTSDINGNWNGLAEDIAREVFSNLDVGVYFCTGEKNAHGAPTSPKS